MVICETDYSAPCCPIFALQRIDGPASRVALILGPRPVLHFNCAYAN